MKSVATAGLVVTTLVGALGAAAIPASCSSSSEAGASCAVVLEGPSASLAEGAITNDLGYAITLRAGYVVTTGAEILGCASAADRLRAFVIAPARAHTEGSSTRLGDVAVESLLAPPKTRVELGLLLPPAARYCRARLSIGRADADAANLPTDEDLVGSSFVVRGEAERAGVVTEFALRSADAFDVELDVDLNLESDGEGAARAATLVFARAHERLFDGVDFEGAPGEPAAAAFAANLKTASRASVE